MKKNYYYGLLLFVAFLFTVSCKQTAQVVEETEIRELPEIVVQPEEVVDEEAKIPQKLPVYNASYERRNDILHTKLELAFDWSKQHVLGKAWIDVKPLFYPTKTLELDAKGFDLHEVKVNGKTAKYDYKDDILSIDLGRTFTAKDPYQVYIDYTAKPNEREFGGSAAITSEKGLFFINPLNNEGNKPQQIWTQGETENNSAWFPTVDKPNERMTNEIYLTVQDRFKTLSNGVLKSSKKNANGTRTDHWVMDMPHTPYLLMLAIGEFAVVEEYWKGKLLQYFVEPEYKASAKEIYSNTPEMLTFFSDYLGVPYPWQKYSQVVVRDYVSGAMENTTAVIFGDFVQKHKRELIDNHNERIVAHELIHHWFGDLVTCESWANLTMNEGFANYGEYLWLEHQYGRDAADYHRFNEIQSYLGSSLMDMHPLIDFGYENKEDMFDAHSYNKGGAILHMLRRTIGEDAFRAGLKKYLNDHKFRAVEAHDLRLAFEEVTGRDLNWFFNQWYFNQGHPELNVRTKYDATKKEVAVSIEQVQNPKDNPAIFVLPMFIDIYTASGKAPKREMVTLNQRKQTFRFPVAQAPKLVNVDGDHALLAIINHKKTEKEYAFQYYNAPLYDDRATALLGLSESNSAAAHKVKEDALNDPFWSIRNSALSMVNTADNPKLLDKIAEMAKRDKRSQIRAAALLLLTKTGNPKYVSAAKYVVENDQAYPVIAAGLEMLSALEPSTATQYASKLENETNGSIISAVSSIFLANKQLDKLDYFKKNLNATTGYTAINFYKNYATLAALGGKDTMVSVAQTMEKVALNKSQSPWRKLAATNAIDMIYMAFKEMGDTANTAQIKTVISNIKAKETNARLKEMYGRYGM